MKIYKYGDACTAPFEVCGGFVPATFRIRNVPISDSTMIAKDVLVIVCDTCDEMVAFPPQSLETVQYYVKLANGASQPPNKLQDH